VNFRSTRIARAARAIICVGLAGVGTGATPAEDAASPNPQAIVARAFQNLYGFTSVQRVEIRARRGDGREYLRSVQVARRGASDGLNRMLVRFLGPGDLRGIGLLLLERPDFSYDAFLYQPALARVRRVSVAQRADAFFGTDVFFEDLEGKRSAQWRARLLRAETVAGRPALVIELQPNGIPSGYDRVVGWFDRELPLMLRAEFYRGGQKVKDLEIDPKRILQVGSYYVPGLMTFRRADGSVTTVEIPEVDLRDALPDDLFTQSVLEFGDERLDLRKAAR
jgi:Outer membrane lipoprotein-sorting protein